MLPPYSPPSTTMQSLHFTQILPIEIVHMIFYKASENIFALSQVDRRCRAIVFSEGLFKHIVRSNCIDAEDWKKCFGDQCFRDLGMTIPQLPERAELGFETYVNPTVNAGKRVTSLQNLASKIVEAGKRVTYLKNLVSDFMLTLRPTSVKVEDEEGNARVIFLDSVDAVKEMLRFQKNGHRIGFNSNSWSNTMAEKRQNEKTHYWVWINKRGIGKGENYKYTTQKALVQKQNFRAQKANVSDLIDTVVSVLMNYIKTGEKCFEWDRKNPEYTIIRVNDMTGEWHIGVCVTPAGLLVYPECGYENKRFAVAVARKSIGLEPSTSRDLRDLRDIRDRDK